MVMWEVPASAPWRFFRKEQHMSAASCCINPWTGTPGSGRWVDLQRNGDAPRSVKEDNVPRCRSHLYKFFGVEVVDQLTDTEVLELCAGR